VLLLQKKPIAKVQGLVELPDQHLGGMGYRQNAGLLKIGYGVL
jgi:hypothetical protein